MSPGLPQMGIQTLSAIPVKHESLIERKTVITDLGSFVLFVSVRNLFITKLRIFKKITQNDQNSELDVWFLNMSILLNHMAAQGSQNNN